MESASSSRPMPSSTIVVKSRSTRSPAAHVLPRRSEHQPALREARDARWRCPDRRTVGRQLVQSAAGAAQCCVRPGSEPATAEWLRFARGTHRDIELILVARTPVSSAAAKQIVEPQEGVKHILAPEEMSPGEALNLGCASATGTFVLLSSDDVLYPRGTVARLLALLSTRPEWGLVGPRCAYAQGAQGLPPGTAELMESVEEFAWFWHEAEAGASKSVSVLGDFCLLARRDFLLSLGGVDPTFAPGTHRGRTLHGNGPSWPRGWACSGRRGSSPGPSARRLRSGRGRDAPVCPEVGAWRWSNECGVRWCRSGSRVRSGDRQLEPFAGHGTVRSRCRGPSASPVERSCAWRSLPPERSTAGDPARCGGPPPLYSRLGLGQLLASFIAAFRPKGGSPGAGRPQPELTNVAVSLQAARALEFRSRTCPRSYRGRRLRTAGPVPNAARAYLSTEAAGSCASTRSDRLRSSGPGPTHPQLCATTPSGVLMSNKTSTDLLPSGVTDQRPGLQRLCQNRPSSSSFGSRRRPGLSRDGSVLCMG